ncbi:MAG TPA: ABC transporter permease [Candidatus Atribacteria bacterium]|jgi:putative ABC transport system permease protein|nr:ABC transporter permease [Candidatus Atribacteria bacterium]
MKFLWNLAKKNLSRSKIRTSVSIIAIAVAIIAVVFARGLIGGVLGSSFENHINYKAGHIRVINKEYKLKERLMSLNYTIDGFNGKGYSEMSEKIKSVKGVKQVVPRLEFGAMVSLEDELVGMMGWGVDPNEEIKFTKIDKSITEGRMVELGNKEVVMGAGLLKKLKRGVGDKVTILYTTPFGSFKGSTFKIVGKIQSSLPMINDNIFYLPLDQAQRILEMPGEVTELLLITTNRDKAASFLPGLNELFSREDESGKYILQLWNKDYDLIELLGLADKIYNFIYIFIIILACFVLVSTLIMIVNERTREIGMMSALGLKSREILYLFTIEGIIIGILGSAIGTVLGGILTKIFSVVGIDYSAAFEGVNTTEFLMSPIYYTVFSLENLVFCFVLGVIVVTIACVIPARKAAKLEPTEALRQI